jgi:hypothetical protein
MSFLFRFYCVELSAILTSFQVERANADLKNTNVRLKDTIIQVIYAFCGYV